MKAAAVLATVVSVNVALGLGGFAGTASAAAPPANDHIAGATVVTALPFTQTLDTTAATTDDKDVQVNASCGAPATNNSVWYKFTAGPTDTLLAVDTTGSDFSAGVIIATGRPGSLTSEACGPVSTQVSTSTGTIYFILVFDDSGSGGTLQLSIHGAGRAPVADKLAGARVIRALPFTSTRDTTGAGTGWNDTQANKSCGAPSIGHSVWYEYTADATDTAIFADASASSFEAGVIIATGTRGALSTVTCGPFNAMAAVMPGTTYFILIFDAGGGTGGTLHLSVDVAPTVTTTLRYKTLLDSAGVAQLNGTYVCTNGGPSPLADISGQLVEIEGSHVVTGTFDAGLSTLNCNGSSHRWFASGVPQAGQFVPGKAAAITIGFVCGLSTCAQSTSAVVVNFVSALPSANASSPAPVTSSSTRSFLRHTRRMYGTRVQAAPATWGH